MERLMCKYDNCPCYAWAASTEGLCYGHEQQRLALERKQEKPKKPIGRPRKNVGECATEGCTKPAVVKGFCKTCDQRIRRNFG